MAVFDRVRIEANENLYPVLLGNGNRIEWGLTEGSRHYATWADPYPKPSYLFCIVALVRVAPVPRRKRNEEACALADAADESG